MPYSDFNKVAKCLDNKRLGKQRVEVLQIYHALTKEDYGWKNHPIVKMWKGYEEALLYYGIDICDEWISRGFIDTLKERFEAELRRIRPIPISTKLFSYKIEYDCPDWVDDTELHLTHQSNLLRKDKAHYSKYFKDVPDNLEYKWVK